jgi:hypothetical protein
LALCLAAHARKETNGRQYRPLAMLVSWSLINLMRRTFVFTVMLTVLISDLFMPLSFASDDNALDGDARSIAGANTNAVDFGK